MVPEKTKKEQAKLLLRFQQENNEKEPETKNDVVLPTLHSFGYFFNTDGKLCSLSTNEPFKFVNSEHYEEVGQLVLRHIQTQMQTDPFGALQEIWLPLSQQEGSRRPTAVTRKRARSEKENSFCSPSLRCNVFMSPSSFEGDKLLIFICGMGPVRYLFHPPSFTSVSSRLQSLSLPLSRATGQHLERERHI